MSETLNFGPEWLRALSTGGSGGVPQFKLAEHRYGREEMLALFCKTEVPPELAEFHSILRKECQSPLTLTPLSEEERWSLSQSVNSTMAIRATGRGAGGAPPAARGRGVSRGRGRGREYKRSITYEEDGGGGFARREYNRTMSWDDSNDNRYEKGPRPDRGYEDEGSPRKVIERERGSTSDNWRSPRERGERIPSRYEEEEWRRPAPRPRLSSRETDENWRSSGSSQAPPRTNWHSRDRERANSSSEFDHDRGDGFRESDRDKSLRERHYSGSRGRQNSQPEEEEMPAWSNLDEDFDDDEIGVFDSSGAFTAVKKSDLEKEDKDKGGKEEKEKGKEKSSKDSKDKTKDKPPEPNLEAKGTKSDKPARKPSDEDKPHPKNNNILSNVQSNSNLSKPPDRSKAKSPVPQAPSTEDTPAKPGPTSNSVPNIVKEVSRTEHVPPPAESKVSDSKENTVSASKGAPSELPKTTTTGQAGRTAKSPIGQLLPTPESEGPSQLIPGGVINVGGAATQGGAPSTAVEASKDDEEDQLQHLEKAAEDLMAELDEDEKLNEELNTQTESQLIPTPKITAPEEPPMVVPPTHKDARKWFYKDPQNQVQGPFNSSEMLEWFRAGYFTLTLQVKQGMDENFQPLGALIKLWGKVPFMTSPPSSSPVPPQMINPTQPTPAPAAPTVPPQQVAPQMGAIPSPGPNPTVLPEHWSKIAQMTVLAQKKQQQIMQQQQQQQAFHTLLQQQQSLIRVSASRIYQDLIQRGKTLTLPQQQALRQQLVGLQQQHQLLLQQQQNWARVQQALNIVPQPQGLSTAGMAAAGRMSKPPMMMMKDAHNPADEMQISVWDPVPTEKSRSEWAIGVWDPEMAKDITEEDRIKAAQQEAIRRKFEEEQEKILRGQEMKFRQEERRRIEESQAKRIEEELRRAQEEQLIMEEIRKNNELKLKELEAEHKELQAKVLGQPVVSDRKSPVEVAKSPSPDESKQQEDLKKLEELHQKQKEAEEQLKMESEKRKNEEAQHEAARKELERAAREQEERKRELEKQEQQQQQILRQQQETQRQQQQQQQDAIRKMQQQAPPPQTTQPLPPQTTASSIQANNFSLPSSAMWGQQRPAATTSSSAPTLAQIQQMQQQQEEIDRQNRQRQIQMLEQQRAAQQQQQAQQAKAARSVGWATSQRAAPAANQSLREIQEEQARQQLERQRQSKAAPNLAMVTTPTVTGSAWGSSGSSASNGSQMAWGGNTAVWNRSDLGQQRSSPVTTSSASMGFWDDAQDAIARTSAPSSTKNYPPLRSNSTGGMTNQRQQNKSRIAKEEENVHRLFQGNVGSDEFSQWCEVSLQSMGASVDIPTFITFLQEVESPYEVHEYVKTYLGDSSDSSEFARKFLERRTRFKEHQQRKQSEQMKAWINQVKSTASGMSTIGGQLINTTPATTIDPLGKRKDEKKGGRKRQLVDPSILGFSVSAAERVNIGEIQTIDDA